MIAPKPLKVNEDSGEDDDKAKGDSLIAVDRQEKTSTRSAETLSS